MIAILGNLQRDPRKSLRGKKKKNKERKLTCVTFPDAIDDDDGSRREMMSNRPFQSTILHALCAQYAKKRLIQTCFRLCIVVRISGGARHPRNYIYRANKIISFAESKKDMHVAGADEERLSETTCFIADTNFESSSRATEPTIDGRHDDTDFPLSRARCADTYR